MMKTLLLVDGSSYLYRAFHAMPDLRSPQGEPTGAIYGVLNMLRKLRADYPADYSACVFDAKGKTFRDDWYPEYKAHRPPMPDDLRLQIEPLHEVVAAAGWNILMVDGVEADDVIGTLAQQASQSGVRCIVSTGDKDLTQLVNQHVMLVNTMSNEVLDEAGVLAKFGVPPERIVDYLSLVGDTVDNVPGVTKCGPKTAVKWLTQYGTLENLLAHADEVGGVVGDNLRAARDWLPQGRRLVTVKCDVALDKRFDELAAPAADDEQMRVLFERFGFKSWLREVAGEAPAKKASPSVVPRQFEQPALPTSANDTSNYEAILTDAQLDAWLEKLMAAPLVSLDTETTGLDEMTAQLVGISFCIETHHAAYLPLAHHYPGAPDQLNREHALQKLKHWLESASAQEAGAEPQIRPAHLRQSRHRAGGHRRRHAAAILRAGIAQAARHGQSRAAPSRAFHHQLCRRGGQGREADRLRPGRSRHRHALRGGGCRHHAATAPDLVAASCKAVCRRCTATSNCRCARCCSRWSATACSSTAPSWRDKATSWARS